MSAYRLTHKNQRYPSVRFRTDRLLAAAYSTPKHITFIHKGNTHVSLISYIVNLRRKKLKTHSKLLLNTAFISLLSFGIIGCDKSVETTRTPVTDNTTASEKKADSSDLDVASNVKTALMKDASVGVFDITVIVSNGDVRLSGFVDNAAQLEQALNLARSVEGVRSVHNELKIREGDAASSAITTP